jgi:hypothetical protein
MVHAEVVYAVAIQVLVAFHATSRTSVLRAAGLRMDTAMLALASATLASLDHNAQMHCAPTIASVMVLATMAHASVVKVGLVASATANSMRPTRAIRLAAMASVLGDSAIAALASLALIALCRCK